MGHVHSTPVDSDSERDREQRPLGRRQKGKLTKPRTNSGFERDTNCLPLAPLSPPRFSTSRYEHGGREEEEHERPERPYKRVSLDSLLHVLRRSRRSSSKEDRELEDTISKRFSMFDFSPIARSTTSSEPPATATSEDAASSLCSGSVATRPDQDVDRMLMRRKSQLRAAPPATATRMPSSPRLSLQHSKQLLAPTIEARNEAERCLTPSSIGVTGAYQRGSLRVTNGAASPSPLSIEDAPDVPEIPHWETTMRAPQSMLQEASPFEEVQPQQKKKSTDHVFEVRLLPPSNPETPLSDPNSPFSFTAPETDAFTFSGLRTRQSGIRKDSREEALYTLASGSLASPAADSGYCSGDSEEEDEEAVSHVVNRNLDLGIIQPSETPRHAPLRRNSKITGQDYYERFPRRLSQDEKGAYRVSAVHAWF